MKPALAAIAGASLLLAACAKAPPPPAGKPSPALWEVRGPHGEQGWLFGTVHALPEGFEWRTPALSSALGKADELVLEIAPDADGTEIPAIFTALGRSPGHPALSERVEPRRRAQLLRLMDKAGLVDPQTHETETWAAAIMLAQASAPDERDGGVEKGLVAMAAGKPIAELEGARAQLGIFDQLPEADQRDLLNAVLDEADSGEAEDQRLAADWRRGDMKAMEAETNKGMLADRELREALLLARNRDWAGKVSAMLKAGKHPFVAAGAGHMAGADGLPALLGRQGWTVRRIQ